MTTENQSASGTPTVISDDSKNQDEIILAKDEGLESRNKLLKQLKDERERNKLLETSLSQFEQERRSQEEQKLAQKGQFEELNKRRLQEIEELKRKIGQTEEEKQQAARALEDTWKLQAVFDLLPGKIKNRKYLQHIDLDKVAFDHETGQVDVESAALVVNDFMKEHKDLVDVSHFGKLPPDAAKGTNIIGVEKFKELSSKEMKKNFATAVRLRKQQLGVK